MPRYVVTLTDEEKQKLKTLVQKGGKGYRIRHAQILLKLDRRPENKDWSYDRIKEAYGASHSTIAGVAKRFVMEGMEAALGRKQQVNRHRKVTGDVEARICAIACSQAPEGATHWTMQAIADELIRLEIVDYITDTTVCEVMKKNEIKPWLVKEWCIPWADAEFVAKMEDILELYQRLYDPIVPVICIDETNKQLIQQTRIPCESGRPEKVDYEYIRNGICEPLAGRRQTVVTESRTAIDFAEILRYVSDQLYSGAEKIVLVTDNLNIHAPASLYKAFPPQEARRLAQRFEWHYTPKHGSWLDMAEIEIGIMSRQALSKPLPDLDSFKQQIRAWTSKRNSQSVKVNWQFTTHDARIKLARLYPTIV